MKKLLLLITVMVLIPTQSKSEMLGLGAQFTVPYGASSQWIELQNGGCKTSGQCTKIPTGKSVKQCTGTQSIKIQNVELLARIVCGSGSNYEQAWIGHNLSSSPTVRITTPMLPLDPVFFGDGSNSCWIEYQVNNSGQSSPVGGGWEMQATCSVE